MNPDDSGTPSPGSADIVANAIANSAAGPQVPLGDQSDALYDEATKPKEGDDAPAQPKQDPETPPENPAPAENATETEGYFADEGLDDDEPQSPQTPVESGQKVLPASFTAEEQYIAQNIGQPITVRIKVGDQVQAVQAYSPENLPEQFEYASERDRTNAMLGFDRLSRKAENLQTEYTQQQQQEQVRSFSEQEDADIQRDIAYLQRNQQAGNDGLGLFKYQPNDPRFESDVAVKEMQQVLDFYNTENRSRWEQSQRSGRQYRPMTYVDAFKAYRIDNPKVGPKQQEEDEQRKGITRPLAKAGRSSGDTPSQQRPKLPRNASIDQIITAYKL
jgi:hypothetical protein